MEISKEACRVCLQGPVSTNGKWESESIHEMDTKDNLTFAHKFTTCTKISILNSQYAKKICKRCIHHLNQAFTFYNICQRTEKILQNYTNREEKRIERRLNRITNEKQKFKTSTATANCNSSKKTTTQQPIAKRKINNKFTTSIAHKKKTCSKNNKLGNDFITEMSDNATDLPDTGDKDESQINIIKSNNNNQKIESVNLSQDTKKKTIKKRKKPEEESSLICEICGNIYKRRHLLANHMRMHSGKKDFKCEICSKEFMLATYLTSHMKTHTGVKNFSCSYCSRRFYSNGKRRAHEKVHRGETSYQCKICDKIFKYSQSLKKHLFIHSGMKPYKCPECDKEFRTMCNLKQHLTSGVHRDKIHIPPILTALDNNEENHQVQFTQNDHHQPQSTLIPNENIAERQNDIFNSSLFPIIRLEQQHQQQQQFATDFSVNKIFYQYE